MLFGADPALLTSRTELVNHAGLPPDLLRKRRDKDNPRVTVWEFRNQSIPPQEWEKKRPAIETALGCPNIDAYNETTGQPLPRLIFACDQVAEMLDKTGADNERKKLLSQIESMLSLIRIWCISDGQRYGEAAQGFSLCNRSYAENGAASSCQARWSISCPHGRFFQMVGERSQTGAKNILRDCLR